MFLTLDIDEKSTIKLFKAYKLCPDDMLFAPYSQLPCLKITLTKPLKTKKPLTT